MKRRRFLAAVSAMLVAISAMSFVAFADEESTTVSTEGTSIVDGETETEVEANPEVDGGDTVADELPPQESDGDTATDELPPEEYDGNPSFQYYGEGEFHLYAASDAILDLNATAGGTAAFLLQLNKQAVIDKEGYAISVLFTRKDGTESGYAITSTELPNNDIEPDPRLLGEAGGWRKEDVVVLPINVREALEEADVKVEDVAELVLVDNTGAIEYIAIGTYVEPTAQITDDSTKSSPATGIADVAAIAAGIAILAGGACMIVSRKNK